MQVMQQYPTGADPGDHGIYICDQLCENPPCSRMLHLFTKTAVKS